MKIFYNKAFKNYFLLTITLFLIEVIFRALVGIPVFDKSLLRIFIGVNVIAFLFGLINSFFGRIAGDILNFAVSMLCSLYALVQTIYFNFFGFFMSFGVSSQYDALNERIGELLTSFKPLYLLIFIPSILLVLFFFIFEKRTYIMELNDSIDFADKFNSVERKELNKKNALKHKKSALIADRVSIFVLAIISVGLYYFSLNMSFINNDFDMKSPSELFINPDMPNIAIKQFGVTGYAFVDAKSIIKPSAPSSKNYPYANGFEKQNQSISDFTRFINDVAWEKVIESETNANYKTLNNYYISQEITDKNDLTGIFKDKNLIIISMESVNNAIINKDYFPNIYKLYNQGWSWDNSYSPRSACASGNGEFSAMTSLYTINNKCTINDYKNNKYHESIFNLFKNYQYQTSSFYNFTDKYYARKTIHPNMGVDNYYGAEELGIPYKNSYGEWPSDIDLMEEVLENINTEEKFFTWISTSTTSEPYSKNSEYGDLHLADFKNTNYNIELKRYLSKLKVLDDAIGVLLKGIEEKGILNDTVIVLYSNHTPYSLKSEDLNNYFDYDVNAQRNIDKTPFIIYNAEISATKHDELTSYINIVPTIANLFGLEYDPRLYLGDDLFDKNYEEFIIFGDGSWQDKNAFYNATTNKIEYFSDTFTYSDEEIKKINEKVKNKYLISSLTIRTNYFNYLNSKIEEYKVSVLPQ